MKSLLKWGIFTLILTVGLHFLGIKFLPQTITQVVINRIFNMRQGWKVNQMNHPDLRTPGNDPVPMDNPDALTSLGVFDLSDGPMRVTAPVPDSIFYWSVSGYDWGTNNFFVLNDQEIGDSTVSIVVKTKDQDYSPQSNEHVFDSPTEKGVVLIRMLVQDRNDKVEWEWLKGVQEAGRLVAID